MIAEHSDRRSAGSTIGDQVKLARHRRGLSISELARRSGISKGTLSNIESGSGNPTIGTLDVLAVALALPLADLIFAPHSLSSVHVRATDLRAGSVMRELLQRLPGAFAVEVWRLRMPPHQIVAGSPHAPGTIETLIVAEGQLEGGMNVELTPLAQGDCLSFPGDQPHSYRTADVSADVTVLITSPQELMQRPSPGGGNAAL